jgi:uncharacterized protein (TIGR02284 family)
MGAATRLVEASMGTGTATNIRAAAEDKLAAALASLAAVNRDAEMGYDAAARDAEEPELRGLFEGRAAERRRFGAELRLLLAELATGVASGPMPSLPPGWVSDQATTETRRARTARHLLEVCDRGETVARKAYESVLREVPLFAMPLRIRSIVQRQYAALLASHADVQRAMWRE